MKAVGFGISCLSILFLAAGVASGSIQHIYLLHTNDIHGALLPGTAFWLNRDFPPPLSNAPGALTVIRELRDEAKEKGYGFLLLDAGDVFKGTPLGDFTKGQVVVDYFNRAGYDAIGVGNYDFALGRQVLEQLVDSSDMPWLCANIQVPGSDTTPGFLRPHLLLERGGLRIGVFGLITSYNNEMIEDSVAGDLEVKPEKTIAQEQIAELRQQGADIIVGLTHIGHKYEKRLAEDVAGFDVIVGGRSHTVVNPPFETPRNHTIVCQAASRLTAVGFLDLSVSLETRRIVGYEGRLINLLGEEIPKDLDYLAYLDSLRTIAEAGFDEVIGTSVRKLVRVDLKESPVGNFVTDAMREYTNADVAVHNSTGIRKDVPEGGLTYRDAYEIDAFGNTLVTGEYTGRQVREMLEISVNGRYSIFQVSGLRMTYSRKRPFGSRVLSVTVGDKPLEPDRTYRVVTNSYLGGGSGQYGVFRDGKDVEDSYVPLRDAIVDYIRRHSPVDARVEGRIVEVDN